MKRKVDKLKESIDKLTNQVNQANTKIRTLQEQIWGLKNPPEYKIGEVLQNKILIINFKVIPYIQTPREILFYTEIAYAPYYYLYTIFNQEKKKTEELFSYQLEKLLKELIK